MIYDCCDPRRRAAVDAHPTLNGIDHLEVLDVEAPPPVPRQRTLLLRLLKPLPAGLDRDNVQLTGGERIRGIAVLWAEPADAPDQVEPEGAALLTGLPEAERVLVIRTDVAGDFSTYTLRLVRGPDDPRPPDGIDPRLAEVSFSFKVECPSDFDCRPDCSCRIEPEPAPDIDYLAKDYATLRRLILDRIRLLVPGWRPRSPADLAVTMAELLAYVGDQLSWWQDAVATEAYLETARRRTSLRRHALLVDYRIHEGSNARAWLQVRVVGGPVPLDPDTVTFLTKVAGIPARVGHDTPQEAAARAAGPEVFEALHTATLHESLNELAFHTWGDEECCLPVGATRATLRGHHPQLQPGMVLVLTEVKGPRTGEPADAEPAHRHAVRVTDAQATDEGGDPLVDPLGGEQITDVRWGRGDALPFPVCISARTDPAHGDVLVGDVSVALGNIVLVDHGDTVAGEPLGAVPEPRLHRPSTGDPCDRSAPEPVPPRYAPTLARGPLTRQGHVRRTRTVDGRRVTDQVPVDADRPARHAMMWDVADTVPAVTLTSTGGPGAAATWLPRADLLDSSGADAHVVVEAEHDGTAHLRFGDDVHGRRPDVGTAFEATYRVGNGAAGNVGAGTITHVVSDDARITAVTNPLPAIGGVEPETPAQIRRRAPQAFRTQQRAVTPADYAAVTERHDDVQQASARLRWTGSWHTAAITVDRQGGEPLDHAFTRQLTDHVDRFRMAGHDLQLADPVHVSLVLEVRVCVADDHLRSDVRRALVAALGSGIRPDGQRAVFHPDNLTFGDPVHVSSVYAAAQRVAGMESVQVTRLHRQDRPDDTVPADGVLRIGAREIARLDNDPNFPEHGVLRLELHGGR